VKSCSARSFFKRRSTQYENLWSSVFKNKIWLQLAAKNRASVVLIGKDIDSASTVGRRHLVLFASGPGIYDAQNTFERSLHAHNYNQTTGEYEFASGLTLFFPGLTDDGPFITKNCGSNLFTEKRGWMQRRSKLATKFCFWADPSKAIRVVESESVHGVGGKLTRIQDLAPVFNIHLPIPNSKDMCPIQAMFFYFEAEGYNGLLLPDLSEGKDAYGNHLIQSWALNHDGLMRCRHTILDWPQEVERCCRNLSTSGDINSPGNDSTLSPPLGIEFNVD
jgi:hypothetical protein